MPVVRPEAGPEENPAQKIKKISTFSVCLLRREETLSVFGPLWEKKILHIPIKRAMGSGMLYLLYYIWTAIGSGESTD